VVYINRTLTGINFKMMIKNYTKKQLTEKIKDIIIDYVFDYSNTEKIDLLKGDGITIEIEPGSDIKKHPNWGFINEILKNSKKIERYYSYRNKEFCQVYKLEEEKSTFHSAFLKRIERLTGCDKTEINDIDVIVRESIQFLCDKSYLKRDQPNVWNIALTTKGIKHYESGRSFEDEYIKNTVLIESNKRSKHSKVISIISLIFSIIIGILTLLFKSMN